jgi:hypothetical protein
LPVGPGFPSAKPFAMQRQIIAHRSTGGKQTLDKVDWPKFYESVKEFL